MDSKSTVDRLLPYVTGFVGVLSLALTVRRDGGDAWTTIGLSILWVAAFVLMGVVVYRERKLRKEAEADATKSYNRAHDLELALKAEKKKSSEAADGWSAQIAHWQDCYHKADTKWEDQRKEMDNLRGELNEANRTITRLTEQANESHSDTAGGAA